MPGCVNDSLLAITKNPFCWQQKGLILYVFVIQSKLEELPGMDPDHDKKGEEGLVDYAGIFITE